MRTIIAITGAALLTVLMTDMASAAATPEQKCQGAKNKAAGAYIACRQKAESGLATRGDDSKYATAVGKCEAKLAAAWQKAIDAAAEESATCPDAPLVVGDYKTEIDALSNNVATALSGDGLARGETCGNNRSEGSETCDGTDLDTQTCATQAPATPYGTLACNSCAFDISGCTAARFVDNGDGTVTDNQTKLTWEKKTETDDINNVGYKFTWSNTGTDADGTAFGQFLNVLNGATSSNGSNVVNPCFVGKCDWRLPTIQELKGIIVRGQHPTIDPIFGPTATGYHVSATTDAASPERAWTVLVFDGFVSTAFKTSEFYVRAVRGGM